MIHNIANHKYTVSCYIQDNVFKDMSFFSHAKGTVTKEVNFNIYQ